MDAKLNLPVIENPNAAKHGYATRLIPYFVDGVQTAWEKVHVNSKQTETRTASPQALRAAGYAAPFADYDPIADDMQRQRRRSACKPVWMGD